MKGKIIGWSILLLISFLPVFLLFYFGPGIENFYTYSEITHKLGQIAALVGMTMFALTFILSTRLKIIEELFGGLDKVYLAHCVLGGTALILILFHPILLVLKFIPSNIPLAAEYLLPGGYWSINFGAIALLGLIGLIFATLYANIKYNKWKFSHKFLGAVFALAVLHIFLVRGEASRDFIFEGYYIYALVVSLIGLGGFIYSSLIKRSIRKETKYHVDSIVKKKDVHEITFSPEESPLKYKAGQFIFVKFHNRKLTNEAHPFSIASKSNAPKIKIFVKELGDFTQNLHHLRIGDKVSIEGPYGKFNKDEEDYDQIWIAGGIGITPFIGMAEDFSTKKTNHRVELYYSSRDENDFIELNKFKEIEGENKHFKLIPWITRERGHLDVKKIIEKSGSLKNKKIYLCGPVEFKKSIKKELIANKVSGKNIYEEEFSFR